MAQLEGKWIQSNTINQDKITLDNDQPLKGRNQADSADVNILKVNSTDGVEFLTQPQYPLAPVSNSDLANKGYILDVMAGLRDPKDACKVASTSNVDIATGGLLNIDSVVVLAGDRVLLKNQTIDSENGIYIAGVGSWLRSTDADTDAEVTNGMSTMITVGLNNCRKIYVLTTTDPITVGTSSLIFAQAPNPANFLVPEDAQITIDATIDGNGFFDLPHLSEAKSVSINVLGGIEQQFGSDFTVTANLGVSRITFAGDLASFIAIGDVLLIKYSYATA